MGVYCILVDFCCSHLVNTGVLTTRDVGSWWLSIPGAGVFMKNFSNGRYFNLSTLSVENTGSTITYSVK